MHSHAGVTSGWRWIISAVGLCLAASAPLACGSSSSQDDPDGSVPAVDAGEDAGAQPIGLTCEGASGERLRQVLREHGDGTSEFLRLHDTEFVETCRFGLASDGVTRCLPEVDGSPFANGAVRYSDAACTVPIAEMLAAGLNPAPAYMRDLIVPDDPCAPSVSVFHELGDRLVIAPETPIFEIQGKTCVQIAQPLPAPDYFPITSTLTPDRFVEGTESFAGGGRIAAGQVNGADGSRVCLTQSFLDRDLGNHPCRPQGAEDGAERCLPGDVGPSQVFSDNACTLPINVALVNEQCGVQARYVIDRSGATCSRYQRVRNVAAARADTFVGGPGACVAAPAEPVVHDIGATVSAFTFAEFARVPMVVGGDRLQRIELFVGDELRLPAGQWRDGQLDVGCTFVTAADGEERCLPFYNDFEPTARVTTRFFSDNACTAALRVGERDLSCSDGEVRFLLEEIEGRTHVYEPGPVQTPLFQSVGGVCGEAPTTARYHLLGDEILAQTFVGGTEMVE